MAEARESVAQRPNGSGKAAAPATPTAEATAKPYPAFDMMRRFAEELDRVFDDFGVGHGWRLPKALTRGHEMLRRETGMIPADWSPRVDLIRADDRLTIRADLPGLKKDAIHVEVGDESVTIRGERKLEKAKETDGYAYNECAYGTFFRSIPLPEGVDASKATAEFRDGVLEVSMPAKPPATKTRRLEVHEKK